MADESNSSPHTEAWSQAGREYWDAWLGLWQQGIRAAADSPGRADAHEPRAESGGAPAGSERRDPEWGRFFEDWWRMAVQGAPPSSADLLQRIADQGKVFLSMVEEYTATAMRSGNAFTTPTDWERVFRSAADGWQRALGLPAGDHSGLGTFWKLPLDTWSRTASSASFFPGDYLENLKPESWSRLSDDVHRNLDRFLSTPGVGYTREWQEQGQELGRLTLEYQRALQQYLALFRRLNLDVVQRVHRTLGERSERQQPITTLRGIYDLWVDCSEAAYLELVSTDAYAAAYGHMVNALMALKRHGRHLVDEGLGAVGMPTRRSLDTLQQRQQELRRELAALRSQLAQAQVGRDEFEALRAELGRLRNEAGARPRAGHQQEPTDDSRDRNGPRTPGSAKRAGGGRRRSGRSTSKPKGNERAAIPDQPGAGAGRGA